jgi:hypothetical protein
VRETTLEKVIASHSAYEIREVDIPLHRVPWILAQIGKRYDITHLAAPLIPWRDWTEDDAWFCSELLAAAMELFNNSSRVTPQIIYLVSKACK